MTQKGGTCVLTAIGSLLDTNVTLNLAMLTLMQKNLQGTIFGGGNPQYDIPQLLSMYKAGKLNLDDMVTTPVQARADQRGLQGHARTARTFAASSATRTRTGNPTGPEWPSFRTCWRRGESAPWRCATGW